MHVQLAAAPLPPSTTLQRLIDVCRTAFDGSHTPPTADIVCGMIGSAFTCLIILLYVYPSSTSSLIHTYNYCL
jgi:hypothetical protein